MERKELAPDFSKIEAKLGLKFKDKNLLKQACVHRSYLNEHPVFELPHNERLEFLGDAVLELAVTEYLYRTFPNKPEGEMTNWRAALVNTQMLAKIALGLDVNDFLFLSHGEAKDTGKAREIILANALEALIGACYLDQGFAAAEKFVLKNVLAKLPEILKKKTYIDPKSKLQEETQEAYNLTPTYKVLEESGPDHAKHFIVGVYLGDTKLGEGRGNSKQQAQVAAANDALESEAHKSFTPEKKTKKK